MTTTATPNALQAVLNRAAAEAPADPPPAKPARAPRAAPAAKPAAAPKTAVETAKTARPDRLGRRFIGGHFHQEVAKQLKILAAEEGVTIQELLEQAVDILFVKAGKAKIAELERRE